MFQFSDRGEDGKSIGVFNELPTKPRMALQKLRFHRSHPREQPRNFGPATRWHEKSKPNMCLFAIGKIEHGKTNTCERAN